MTGTADLLPDVAHELVGARRGVCCVAAPSSRDGSLTVAQAYALAAAVSEVWSRAGNAVDGIKIGFTAPSKWERLGITGPFWGATYDSTTRDAGGEPVDLSVCVAPRLEAEIVVGLAHDLEPGDGAEDVAQAVAWGALGFELVDCHVADWAVTAPDLIADFGAHAGLVVGPRRWLTPEAAFGLSQVAIGLQARGQEPVRGDGEAVLGGPVQAIAALLSAPDAPSLRAGSLISTGALTGSAHPVAPGQSWRIDPLAGPLASVSVAFAPAGGVG